MTAAIDGLLTKHHGTKDILKRVDADYAAMVHRSCTDPNSLLHPTTWQHISRYVKQFVKQIKKHQLGPQYQPGEGFGDTAAVAEFDHRQPHGQCACHNHASSNSQPSTVSSPSGAVTEPVSCGADCDKEKEMSWRQFQKSEFYEAERTRWAAEKGKGK